MNALQAYYASKTVTQKASVTRKKADGDTTGFTLKGRVTGKDDESFVSSIRKHGIANVKDSLKSEDDNGDTIMKTVTLKDGTLKEQVAVALELMGFTPVSDKPAKEKASKPAEATV